MMKKTVGEDDAVMDGAVTFRRYFWVQFLGAFNDNYYKIACTMLVTYRIVGMPKEDVGSLVALAAGLFILPFFMFSAVAGQLADRFDKVLLIRWIKFFEILIMGGAVVGFSIVSIPLLLIIIFLMGAQSAFFGPVKYSIIPELLPEKQLMKGNALVETGTFISILIGTILGGFSMALSGDPFFEAQVKLASMVTGGRYSIAGSTAVFITSLSVMVLAVTGFLFSLSVGKTGIKSDAVRVSPNFLLSTIRSLGFLRRTPGIFPVVLSISYFWFYGAYFLQIIPIYTRFDLRGGEALFTSALAMFSLGIGAGSFLAVKASRGRVVLSSVPWGLAGFIFFPPLLIYVGSIIPGVLVMLFLIGVSGGLFIVPLYAALQDFTPSGIRSRTIAAGCILDALFMVLASMLFKIVSSANATSALPFLFGSLSAVVLGSPAVWVSIRMNRGRHGA